MNITLRQMTLFEATARLAKLSLAAEEQAISQSAASQAIKEMENQLEYRLFQRHGRTLTLSPEGEALLPRIRQILELSRGITHRDRHAVAGHMTLAASVTIASYLAPTLIGRMQSTYPETRVKLSIENSESVLDSVAKGRALLGMIEGPATHPELTITPWQTDQLVIFCPATHPLAQKPKVTFNALLRERWIVRETGSGTRSILDAELQRLGVNIDIAQALNRQEAIKQCVLAGLGIGCLSHLSIARELASGELVALNTPLNLSRRFSWVAAPERTNHPLHQAFIALCQQTDALARS
ncbi:LysR family transcriptional regulator [Gilvimarinus agarilyticus]|uniref:LysR family transcriptional regulator n=1 Tax=Gilvimarinus agarilyticus TaxID=679259 RepID=UPI0005A041DC|nr:LysR family transcriptional regulator [Gilvimarinus agarilyticus]